MKYNFNAEQYKILMRTDFKKDLPELNKPNNKILLGYILYAFFNCPSDVLEEYTQEDMIRELKQKLKEYKRIDVNKIKNIEKLTREELKNILHSILKLNVASGIISSKQYIGVAMDIEASEKMALISNLRMTQEELKSRYTIYIPKKSVKKSTKKTTKKSVKKSVKKTTKKRVGRPAKKSVKKSTKKRVGRPAKK